MKISRNQNRHKYSFMKFDNFWLFLNHGNSDLKPYVFYIPLHREVCAILFIVMNNKGMDWFVYVDELQINVLKMISGSISFLISWILNILWVSAWCISGKFTISRHTNIRGLHKCCWLVDETDSQPNLQNFWSNWNFKTNISGC